MIVQSAIGYQELLPVAIIIVVLFGAKRIPEMMKGVGEGMREFKKASSEINDDSTSKDATPTTDSK